MDALTARYASRPVPRYTSYPAANHFAKDFPPSVYGGWLSALDPDAPISLYLHVPFCTQLCWYCGCNMKLAARYAPVADYANTLIEEIGLIRDLLPTRLKVSHLHFGGGTPTTLSPDDLSRIMATVRGNFDIVPDAELAIECDPRTLAPEMAIRLGALGFTRASLGIQEFDPTVQAAINRVQPEDMVARAVGRLRASGVTEINFDLIYGLPYQSTATLSRTIERCLRLKPDRFSLFGYAHVPWMAKKQRLIPEDALPGPEARMRQAAAAKRLMAEAGYQVIGLDHFALPGDPLAEAARTGTLRRNFQGYTADQAETLIGLGTSSISRTPFGYAQNFTETGAWKRAIEAGHLPIAKGHTFAGDDRLRGHLIERLMCDGSVDTAAVAARAGYAAGPLKTRLSDAFNMLQTLADDGLVELEGANVRMTERGKTLVRVAASAFDAYRLPETAAKASEHTADINAPRHPGAGRRHSMAV